MERKEDRADIVRDVTLGISGAALARFRGFCHRVLGIRIDEVPTEQSIFMRQNYSIVFCAVILFLLTNGFYLVKNIIMMPERAIENSAVSPVFGPGNGHINRFV